MLPEFDGAGIGAALGGGWHRIGVPTACANGDAGGENCREIRKASPKARVAVPADGGDMRLPGSG